MLADCWPSLTTKNKFHWDQHTVQKILQRAPPWASWCMRFEHFHQFWREFWIAQTERRVHNGAVWAVGQHVMVCVSESMRIVGEIKSLVFLYNGDSVIVQCAVFLGVYGRVHTNTRHGVWYTNHYDCTAQHLFDMRECMQVRLIHSADGGTRIVLPMHR